MTRSKITITAISLSMIGLTSCEKVTVLHGSETPTEIHAYTDEHFKENKVVQVTRERDGFTKEYYVILSDGTTIEFNRKKEVVHLDGNPSLPETTIPESIRTYVKNNYPNNFITDWELDNKKQFVELDNDIELVFDKSGEFIHIEG